MLMTYTLLAMQVIPLVPGTDYTKHLAKILILECEGIIEKNSYERHAYESVDDISLS